MREKMKGSSRPTGRGLSKSEKSQRGELITWNGFREKLYRGRGMPRTSSFITTLLNKVTHSFLTLPGMF